MKKTTNKNLETLLAIDFGTSNSLVGFVSSQKYFESIPLDPEASDSSMMRSLVYFQNEDQAFYGSAAIKEYIQNEFEGRLFRSFKSHLPNTSYLGTMVGKNRRLPIEELVGLFLLQLKKRAETQLEITSDAVVLGRPARYSMDPIEDELALHRMKKAAEYAGFKHVLFVPEPLAAAFNYRKSQNRERTILIGDFGGGTSDFTVMRINSGEFKKEDVLAIEGCPLAGDFLDSLFMSQNLNRYFGSKVQYRLPMSQNILTMPPLILERLNKPAHMVHLKELATYEFIKEIKRVAVRPKDKQAIERLLCLVDDNQIFAFFEEIEKIKRKLSSEQEATFHFTYPEIEIQEHITRQQFEDWAIEFKSQVFMAMEHAMTSAQVLADQIDLVFLTGGTAFVPMIHEEFVRRFGADKLNTGAHFHSVQAGLVEAADLLRRGYDLGLSGTNSK